MPWHEGASEELQLYKETPSGSNAAGEGDTTSDQEQEEFDKLMEYSVKELVASITHSMHIRNHLHCYAVDCMTNNNCITELAVSLYQHGNPSFHRTSNENSPPSDSLDPYN